MSYQCPLCFTPLSLRHQTWHCLNGHAFDQAKEGYVNLLPAQHKNSKLPGDSLAMVQARRAFLDLKFYQPLCQVVSTLVGNWFEGDQQALLDIGCGEGYYTAHIAEKLHQQGDIHFYGLDIAKVAIRYAAKRYSKVNFCVASSQRLPFESYSINTILSVYAPYKLSELQRVLTEKGIFIVVTPAARHLYQLKEQIYNDVQLHDNQANIDGFTLMEQQRLSYVMKLTSIQLQLLLQMTPFFWRTTASVQEKLLLMDKFQCETDFLIRVFAKNKR